MTEKNTIITPPYWLGLLCFLPLIGAIVGITMIIKGITKYKDKKFILIGYFGILFTITVYSLLFYNLKYGKATAKGFAEIAQIELNSLFRNVEFYKIENGQYPDSLQQLIKVDPTLSIYDPLLVRKMDNDVKSTFEYQKIGEKYRLFSVGIDGKIDTDDDIYPVLDTSVHKYGLIRRLVVKTL
ncbi:type II secretion system protein GspG [Ferruginibacter lapsinanis]|uniref:type II secretion system protein GspG n=1 Tax=Ferruginibacter lapsinanis TaxID=563172 RepID=UPI001E4BD7D8|nr:type II secretion system protein GspG [Ferruginibacter lapsinanis]UEG49296.1 type II secretion system protein GspG [Ferruginibacter lapsinanis]